jgi:hypothetical protein
VCNTPFETLTYTEAIDILKRSKKSFEFPVEWGCDLQSEHERFLSEEHIGGPLNLIDYPNSNTFVFDLGFKKAGMFGIKMLNKINLVYTWVTMEKKVLMQINLRNLQRFI